MAPPASTSTNQAVLVGSLAAAAAASLIYWYLSETSSSSSKKGKEKQSSSGSGSSGTRGLNFASALDTANLGDGGAGAGSGGGIPATPPGGGSFNEEEQTPLVQNRHVAGDKNNNISGGASTTSSVTTSNSKREQEKNLHARIEELDKKGKALFKNKQFLMAAETFTEALELIGEYDDSVGTSSLSRQLITLMNNRSAMYEKASMPELALDDCGRILDLEPHHGKARTRKLRILEALQRWYDALQEICAMQLLFMQANRTNLRMGLPTPPPPVPQSKMEEVLQNVVPLEVEKYSAKLLVNAASNERPPPSSYTILQLLKSYTGYNQWMAQAAKDGSVSSMAAMPEPTNITTVQAAAERATGLYKRGRRHVYDGNYKEAMVAFEEGFELLSAHYDNDNDGDATTGVGDCMPDDAHARLLEWAGMARHWQYRLDGAKECYKQCAKLEPENALVLVKHAGVCMDAGTDQQDEALTLFQAALRLQPNCADALLHRSNLYMIQGKPADAKMDLERCVRVHPQHVMARLRLASILAATQDPGAAKQQLDAAEKHEPNSSEVQSYRGELHFTQGQFDLARAQFEKAMALEPNNPTPYVNAAMAILNAPAAAQQQGGGAAASSQPPDAHAAIRLLEQALEVDPQFMAAYVQLGQLKLGTATELTSARQVIDLYDRALQQCRTADDLKELCSMRILAVAQVEAATQLKMTSFQLQ